MSQKKVKRVKRADGPIGPHPSASLFTVCRRRKKKKDGLCFSLRLGRVHHAARTSSITRSSEMKPISLSLSLNHASHHLFFFSNLISFGPVFLWRGQYFRSNLLIRTTQTVSLFHRRPRRRDLFSLFDSNERRKEVYYSHSLDLMKPWLSPGLRPG